MKPLLRSTARQNTNHTIGKVYEYELGKAILLINIHESSWHSNQSHREIWLWLQRLPFSQSFRPTGRASRYVINIYASSLRRSTFLKLSDRPGGECSGQVHGFYHHFFSVISLHKTIFKKCPVICWFVWWWKWKGNWNKFNLIITRRREFLPDYFGYQRGILLWIPCPVQPCAANDKFSTALHPPHFYTSTMVLWKSTNGDEYFASF